MNKFIIDILEKLTECKRKTYVNALYTKYHSDISISAEDIRIASNRTITGLRDVFMNDYYTAPTGKQYNEIIQKINIPKQLITPDSAAFLFKHYMELIGLSACGVVFDKTTYSYYNVIAIRPEYADTFLYIEILFPSTGERARNIQNQSLNGYIFW